MARSLDKVQRTNSIECIETQLNSIRTQIDKLEEKFTEPIPESIVAAGDDVTFNNSDSKVSKITRQRNNHSSHY